MFCKYCGHSIDDDSIFCNKCGKQISSNSASFSPESNHSSYQAPPPPVYTTPSYSKPLNQNNVLRPPASVSFGTAIKNYYTNFANFEGRAVKSEFWWVYLYNILISLFINIIPDYYTSLVLSIIWSLVHFIPGLALNVRRLHDIGKSGANVCWAFLPLIGQIMLLVWWCYDSDGDNRWGLSPFETKGAPVYNHSTYTAQTSSHVWRCNKCGSIIDKTPCPICGDGYEPQDFKTTSVRYDIKPLCELDNFENRANWEYELKYLDIEEIYNRYKSNDWTIEYRQLCYEELYKRGLVENH